MTIFSIDVKTTKHNEFIDITDLVSDVISKSKISDGVVIVYVPHTTAAVTINENGDPDVVSDILMHLSKMIPHDSNNSYFKHSEGNFDAHIKSSLIGCSCNVLVKDGQLVLGTWQSIYFCEFDGPRLRKVYVKVISD